MDSITHIALGACMGEAFAGKKLGKKAMIWGALAQSIPDIDFFASFWMDEPSNLLAHRGFTHSFLFCALITPVFAMLAERFHRPHNITFRRWAAFFGAVVFIHVFIDAFNNYGVGWFEPFSHIRISFNAVYVADPFFSIWAAIACVALILLPRRSKKRKRWWEMGLVMSAVYLCYCLGNKWYIDAGTRKTLERQHIAYTRYFTTPAPLQNWLWFVVAGNDSGYYAGYRSVFDRNPAPELQFFPRNNALLQPYWKNGDVHKLIRFSQGFYTADRFGDTTVFNDLRFGQEAGWANPRGKFAFHYYLDFPDQNGMVVQRGRFAGWDRRSAAVFLDRIAGK